MECAKERKKALVNHAGKNQLCYLYCSALLNAFTSVCFLLFIFSPYAITTKIAIPNSSFFPRIGTGLLYASALSNSFNCKDGSCNVDTHFEGQRVPWKDVTSELACSNETNIYEKWSKRYELCDKVGGEFSLPADLRFLRFVCVLGFLVSFFCLFPVIFCQLNQRRLLIIICCLVFVLTLSCIGMIVTSRTRMWMDLTDGNGVLAYFNLRGQLVATDIGAKLSLASPFPLPISLVSTLISTTLLVLVLLSMEQESAEVADKAKKGEESLLENSESERLKNDVESSKRIKLSDPTSVDKNKSDQTKDTEISFS
mmetsp:Transcript_13929/g.16895  ORF Transcript_13929/g.16895 Transcript_13929/m.16895 type:complete len:312 (+) Transcript_13929:291-1226(+)